jgi:di/tricarboxylate transporter
MVTTASTRHDTTGFDTTASRVHVTASPGAETKPSFKTTEMIVMVAAVIGVLVAATMDDSLDTQWAWTLISAIAIGYMLSRGLAKSGSRHHEA